jgi:hypothetical protein
MSYVIKDGAGATQTVAADTVGGAIQPISSPVDANGNHIATAPGVANTNAAIAVQGVSGGVAVPITSTQFPTNAAQGSTTSGQTGGLEMGAVTTSAPNYTNGQTSPFTLTTAGALRVDGSGVTQPANVTQIGGTNVVTGGTSGLLGVGGGVASGASNANNPVKIGAAYNFTQPTVTTGQIVDLQATARGGLIVAAGVDGFMTPTGDASAAAGVAAGGNYLFNGATWDRQRAAAGTTGIAAIETESVKATYSGVTGGIALTANGVFLQIQGSGTKTIRLKRVEVSGTFTTAAIGDVYLQRCSTAVSGGTTVTAPVVTPHDSSDAAGTATLTAYSTPGTAGTTVGTLKQRRVLFGPATVTGSPATEWTFGDKNDKAAVLHGTSQYFELAVANVGSFTGAGITFSVEWTEE